MTVSFTETIRRNTRSRHYLMMFHSHAHKPITLCVSCGKDCSTPSLFILTIDLQPAVSGINELPMELQQMMYRPIQPQRKDKV